MRRRAES